MGLVGPFPTIILEEKGSFPLVKDCESCYTLSIVEKQLPMENFMKTAPNAHYAEPVQQALFYEYGGIRWFEDGKEQCMKCERTSSETGRIEHGSPCTGDTP